MDEIQRDPINQKIDDLEAELDRRLILTDRATIDKLRRVLSAASACSVFTEDVRANASQMFNQVDWMRES